MIEEGTDTLIQMLDDIAAKWDGYAISDEYTSTFTGFLRTIDFPCDFCTDIATECASSAAEIDSQTAGIFADLADTKESVGDELTNQNETIMDAISAFVAQIDDVEKSLLDFADTVESERDTVEEYNDQREMAYNALFAVPLVPMVFVLIGGVFKVSACFTIGYMLLWASLVLMMVLLAVRLPVAAVMSDVCDYLDLVDDDVTAYYNDSLGQILKGTSLLMLCEDLRVLLSTENTANILHVFNHQNLETFTHFSNLTM